jgi:hypothetical protein
VTALEELCDVVEVTLMKLLGVTVRAALIIALFASGLVAVVLWLLPALLDHV